MTSESRPLALGINDLLRAFWRYKLLILAIAAVAAVATYAAVSRMPPRYAADGLLVLDHRQITIPELQTAIMTPVGEPRVVQTELQVLRSRSLAEEVVLELGLHEHPLIVGELHGPALGWCDRLGVRPLLPVALCGEPAAAAGDAARPMAVDDAVALAADALRREMWVSNDGGSYAIRLGYFSPDPVLAARVVNTLMDTYIANQVIARQQSTAEANQWLQQRLTELERAVQAADRRVNAYRKEHGLAETSDLLRQEGTLVDQRLVAVNRQLAEARTQLAEAEARYQRATEMVRAGGTAAATSELLTSPRIQSLSEHEAQLIRREAELSVDLGPRHPQRAAVQAELADVRNSLSTEIGRAVRALESDVNVARARVRSLDQNLAELEQQSTAKAQEYARLAQLQREADGARNLYQTFYERVQQTAAGGVMQADARIVSRAVVPRVPVGPRVNLLTALGLLGGLLFGGATALLLSRFEDRFRTLDDLAEVTGLTPLGAVPAVPAHGKRENALLDHLAAYPNSAASETIRSIRVAFKHATPKATKTLLITSALPNDGKTTFAVALGQIAARDGQKVLVIDCDLRKPSLSAAFDHISSYGLEDALTQGVAWQDLIVRDEDSGLFCLPARGGSTSPQQLLESYRFQTLLAEASRAFDLVIVDSPPVMLVSDAIVLSKLVDAIVLVVSWKRTRRRAVTESLKRLQTSGREVGVVLSRIGGRMPAYQVYGGYEYRA